jgi:hypothetical protein
VPQAVKPETASQDCLNCLNKALDLCAQFLPLAHDCVACGLDAQEYVTHLQTICDRASKLKAKLFPKEL